MNNFQNRAWCSVLPSVRAMARLHSGSFAKASVVMEVTTSQSASDACRASS